MRCTGGKCCCPNILRVGKCIPVWWRLHRSWLCLLWDGGEGETYLKRTDWRRITQMCGGGSLRCWPGWWAGFPAQWWGTWRREALLWRTAILIPLIIPEEEIVKFGYHLLVPSGTHQHLLIFFSLIIPILAGGNCISLWFWFPFLWWLMMSSPLSVLLDHLCVFLRKKKCLLRVLCPFIDIFFYIKLIEFFIFLDNNPLSDI